MPSWIPSGADARLVGAAALFGGTFVVVQEGVTEAEPVPFLGVRFAVAVAVLWPVARRRPVTAGLGRDGAAAGLALGTGYVLQTAGLQYTASSTSAFITYLLVVFVPLLSALVLRRPPHPSTVAAVAVAVVGLVLLTGGPTGDLTGAGGGGDGGLGRGEALTLGCAVAFAAHIVILARVAHRHDAVRLTLVQLAVVAAGCGLAGLVFGGYGFGAGGYGAAIATGVGATAVAFVLQVSAQQVLGPTRTALILLMEPVFAAGLGYATGERLGWVGALGAVLILVAVLAVELGPARLARGAGSGHPEGRADR